jgi:O-methyltransferase
MLNDESKVYKFSEEKLALPFYAEDYHFMPEHTVPYYDTLDTCPKSTNLIRIHTTLDFTENDINELMSLATENTQIVFRIPMFGWNEAHDFFSGHGHFQKALTKLEILIKSFPSSAFLFEYQVNCLSAAAFEDFIKHFLRFQASHQQNQIQVELIFKNPPPPYLSLDLVHADWQRWLESGLCLISQDEGDLLLRQQSSRNSEVRLSEQILAALYYSAVMKRSTFSAYTIFPKARDLLKQSAAAFLSVRPQFLDTVDKKESSVLYQELLLEKERAFYKTDIPGLNQTEKENFLKNFYSIKSYIKCAHSDLEMLEVILTILSLPEGHEGVILEAGVFKGGGTARLSWASSLKNRKLLAYDSFCGLPNHNESSPRLLFPQGSYLGTKEEVSYNVKKYGHPKSVELIPGWFSDTLPHLHENVAVAFIDVDLASSTQECLQYIWPKLIRGGTLYSHDAHFTQVNQLFTNSDFWLKILGIEIPKIELIPGSNNLIKITKLI